MEVLQSEYGRLGIPFSPPIELIQREEEEYSIADHILVLSQFAKDTFIKYGFSERKVDVLRLGVELSSFSTVSSRKVTLPLKVLYFGNLSLRKGIPYLLEATQSFPRKKISVTLIGDIEPSLKPLLRNQSHVKLLRSLPQSKLGAVIRDFDVFLFPTIEDGFGQTLLQAMACGLVPIVTLRCGAADIIECGRNGYIIPASSAGAIRNCLQNILENMDALESMKQEALNTASQFSWDNYSLSLHKWLERIQTRHANGLLKIDQQEHSDFQWVR
jgi:glycosyltransferase involved in cell wall biosynthesis